MNFQKELNEQQLKAVTTDAQHCRVIAGAGSGKTRVLTYRIAYLLSELNVLPWKILAITFTNKVANEMHNRIEFLLPEQKNKMTIKTFHSFAAGFLRREIDSIGFPANFTILDEEDQLKLIKDIASSLGYRKTDPLVKKAINYIGSQKLKGKYPDDITIDHENFSGEKDCLEIFQIYEESKNKMYSLDFDDLLLKTNYILETFPDIRMKWQQSIDHILIDEFQDTNDIEYKLVKLLSKPSTCLYVVGDPDQTIYTWRGANQNIIMNVDKEFPLIETIILNRNYRSTQNILNSANKLISNNKFRVKKDLFTQNEMGKSIVVNCSFSGKAEAEYLAREVKRLKEVENFNYKDIVVLYRSNYITMEFESSLTSHGIPYRIFGGTKFYQRREIKDVLAYFHLIVNKNDDISFDRIINIPKRGIGESSVNTIKKEAKDLSLSLYNYIDSSESDNSDANKAVRSLKPLIVLLNKTRDDIAKNEEVFSKTLEDMLSSIGYYDYLIKEDDGDERIDNVKALFSDLRTYLKSNPEATFDEYLQNIALMSAQDEIIDGDFLTLMTVHTAKGLEFPIVFVVRMNAGVFPNARATTEGGYKAMEEERRLAYVAMTRAKQRLYLSYAQGYNYVVQSELSISPFILESGNIPNQVTNFASPYRSNANKKPISYHFDDDNNSGFEADQSFKQDFSQQTNDVDSWVVGDIVIHTKLGKGVVIGLEGDGIITVKFDEHGVKSILGNHKAVSKGEK
ncbi:MAG: UvrD-helicase domain-containing protein [Bacilli bacterium]|nr:UvrD-helicase domain-containing protein [Bacilli bacterium]